MIQVPTLLKVSATSGSVRPFVVFGPAFGFLTTAKFESEGEEEDIKDELASLDVSGIIGAGIQFGVGMMEVRYDHGFTDLDKDGDTSTAKTRTVSILFGIAFGR
jgi:hypothetical protein